MNEFVQRLEPRRFFDAGGLDSSFGTSGHTDLTVENAEFPIVPVDIDSTRNGQVYVTAKTVLPTDLDNETGATYLWRLRPDGTPDTSFGPAGTGLVELPGGAYGIEPFKTVVTPDGGVLVKINSFVYKLKQNGTRDKSFAKNGRLNLGSPVHDYTVAPDGRIYFVTGFNQGTKIRRYSAFGALDTTYDTNGEILMPGGLNPLRMRIEVLNDGAIAVGGIAEGTFGEEPGSGTSFKAVASRLSADGTPDLSFGTNGLLSKSFADTSSVNRTGINPIITADGMLIFTVLESPVGGGGNLNFFTDTLSFDIPGTSKIMALSPPDLSAFSQVSSAAGDGTLLTLIDLQELHLLPAGVDDAAANQRADGAISDSYFPGAVEYQNDGSILVLSGKHAPVTPGTVPGSFDAIAVHRLFRDDSPVAQATARTLTQERNASYRFKVTYRDDDDIDASTLGNDDITVRLPNGTRRRARLVNVALPASDGSVTATYLITSPDGTWNLLDNGEYSIRLERRSVRDTSGNAAAQRQIGTFAVAVPLIVFTHTNVPSAISFDSGEHLDFDELTGKAG